MKPAAFSYERPQSLEEALELRETFGYDSVVLAGGQSLIPLMNFRFARPRVVIDLRDLEDLAHIQVVDGGLDVGAMTRVRALELNSAVEASCPLLRQAAGFVGHVQIRNRGTVGGVMAHADPAAELPVAAMALSATMIAKSVAGERKIPAQSFFQGPFSTDLAENEILTAVEFPRWSTSSAFLEVSRRRGDFAIVAAAVALKQQGQRIERAGVALGGVAGTPVKADTAEAMLSESDGADELLRQAAKTAAAGLSPSADIHGSSEYRVHLAEALTYRGLLRTVGGVTDA